MKLPLRYVWESLLFLVYPRICVACSRDLSYREEVLCTPCFRLLPETGFHLTGGLEMTNKFRELGHVSRAAAFLFFKKEGMVQQLVHSIKYQEQTQVATQLGIWYGAQLKAANWFPEADFIVPVPLHRRKQQERGYNQAWYFALGLQDGLQVTARQHILKRTRYTESQTHKTKQERRENVKHAFSVPERGSVLGKHILLADDVMTTGATLDACAETLLKAGAASVGVVTLAYAT